MNNENIDSLIEKFLNDNKDELLKMKNIPKPFDDVLDSLVIMLILKKLIYR